MAIYRNCGAISRVTQLLSRLAQTFTPADTAQETAKAADSISATVSAISTAATPILDAEISLATAAPAIAEVATSFSTATTPILDAAIGISADAADSISTGVTPMPPVNNQENSQQQKENYISYLTLFWTFFRIGLLTLGGGLAMATVMRHELVLKRQWTDDDDFIAEMSLATLVPGSIAVNVAYLQGRHLRGKMGAATAVLGTVVPAVGLILLVAWVALPYFSHPRVAAFLRGCAIAVGGQLAFAGLLFGRRHLRNWQNAVVCTVGLVIIARLHWHPVAAVVTTGGLDYLLCKLRQPCNPLQETD